MAKEEYKRKYYRHFKGGIYIYLEEALHSETKEEMVIYKSLIDHKIWVRPKAMFFGNNSGGKPRFIEISFFEACQTVKKIKERENLL